MTRPAGSVADPSAPDRLDRYWQAARHLQVQRHHGRLWALHLAYQRVRWCRALDAGALYVGPPGLPSSRAPRR